jgi:TRAP transporter TAXI family solute receptor
MLMKRTIVIWVIVLFVAGVYSGAFAQELKMILATGGTAGTYYPFGGVMTKIWNAKVPGVNVTAQATGASAENVRLVNKKEVELALVQSDTIDFAYHAKEGFKERLMKMNAMAVLYPEIVQIVVRGDGNIYSFGDLKGVRVGVGAPGSGTEANFRQLLEAHGMKKEDVKAQYLSFAESAEQFKDRHIDAFIVVAGIPNAAIMDVAVMQNIRILSLPDDRVAHLTRKYPFLSPALVPPSTYKNQSSGVKTIAVSAVLIAGSDLKEEVVYKLTKALFENQTEFAAAHAKGKELHLKTAMKGVSIPFHPGAIKYYKEKGVLK